MRALKLLMPALPALMMCSQALAADVLLKNVTIYDGTGGAPYAGDVRIRGSHIDAMGRSLKALPGMEVRDEHGLALAPGFIDMHSHANWGILKDPDAAPVARQGVTTVLVGQDGESDYPLKDWYAKLAATPAAINVASMIGHATLREQVMGKDLYRPSTPAELARMKAMLSTELKAGAFGLSTGLEYEQGHFATTEEVIELAKIAGASGGFYISHVRDEANNTFASFDEILRIGREAHLPVEITHIKLGSTPVWHMAARRMPGYFARAAREHVDLRADVYPYTYWKSTIRVIVPDRDYYNPVKVEQAIKDNGGAGAIRITTYAPEPALAGKTLEDFARTWNVTPVDAYMRVVKATSSELDTGEELENVIVTSMSDDDVRWFIGQPQITFCSDGELHGAHPRGAGTFPRVLGRYAREQKVLTLASAIQRMSALPARQLGLTDRGRIAKGMVADLVLFDPLTVIDQATIEHPDAPPLGIPAVMVSGEWVIDGGEVTGRRPGRILRSAAYRD